jgi:diguanylate cyclase (GGDEF)-like protein
MEYPSLNDFYYKLKAEYDKNGNITDYILIYVSDNFYKATDIDPERVLNRRISEIVVDNDDSMGLKDLYLYVHPKTSGKYEIFIKNLDRWYIVNIFTDKSDENGMMFIHYSDISTVRNNNNFLFDNSSNGLKNNIYYLKDKERLYYKDKLTGLYNKCFLDEEILRLDTKRQLPISLIMGDINGLKLINDAFGHYMGDRSLKKAAEIISGTCRSDDIISRIGGDEFVMLLPRTSEDMASSIVERIKRECENNPLDFIKINISFGAATKTSVDEDIYQTLGKAEERMYFNKLKESKKAKQSMINFLKSKLEKITFETKAHYDRLKELSLIIADELNLSDVQKEELRLLCEFHDIGKIGVSKNILQKTGSLNTEEWENIKRHSEIGYYIAKEFREATPIDELILIHHERWDGNGYPGFLKDEEIPIVARVFAIADAYDAMVNGRPYKDRMTNKDALKEIRDKSGSQFDPNIADIFIRKMEQEKQII